MRANLRWIKSVLGFVAFFILGAFSSPQFLSADSFDWRTYNGQNWLTTVKNQYGGTCWDFSSCGTIEAKYKLTCNDSSFNPDISEQQMTSVGIGTMENGGWGVNVFNYVKNNGIVSEAMLPVVSPNQDVSPAWAALSQTNWKSQAWKLTSYQSSFRGTRRPTAWLR